MRTTYLGFYSETSAKKTVGFRGIDAVRAYVRTTYLGFYSEASAKKTVGFREIDSQQSVDTRPLMK